jgi:hypothetical protein
MRDELIGFKHIPVEVAGYTGYYLQQIYRPAPISTLGLRAITSHNTDQKITIRRDCAQTTEKKESQKVF